MSNQYQQPIGRQAHVERTVRAVKAWQESLRAQRR